MTDYDDLLTRMRDSLAAYGLIENGDLREAIDALTALREQVARTDARCEEVEDRYEQTAARALDLEQLVLAKDLAIDHMIAAGKRYTEKAEADSVALRQVIAAAERMADMQPPAARASGFDAAWQTASAALLAGKGGVK